MTSLLGLGVLAQLAADAVVGVRLLRLARRTRRAPEALLGLCCLLLGGVGFPLSIAARSGAGGSPAADGLLLAAALAFQNLACASLYGFVWRSFRLDGRLGLGAALFGVTLLAASVPGQAVELGFAGGRSGGAWYWLGLFARAAAFGWAAVESLRFAALLRRRERLGLADPVVADRFRLFGVCCAAVFVTFAVFGAVKATGVEAGTHPGVLAVSSLGGLVGGATLWLAFAPPRAYLRRVARRRA